MTTTTRTARKTAAAKGVAKKSETKNFDLDYTKDTKGTVVFGSEDEDAPLSSLYIRKNHGVSDTSTVSVVEDDASIVLTITK